MGRDVWKFVPQSVRAHWENSLLLRFPRLVTGGLRGVEPVFKDVTQDILYFEKIHTELKLGDIVEAYTDLMPRVLCPWGCAEHVFNCGELDFEHVFGELVCNARWTLLSARQQQVSMSFRRDYLDGNHVCLLQNEAFRDI